MGLKLILNSSSAYRFPCLRSVDLPQHDQVEWESDARLHDLMIDMNNLSGYTIGLVREVVCQQDYTFS